MTRVWFLLASPTLQIQPLATGRQVVLDVAPTLEDEYLGTVPTFSWCSGVVELLFVIVEVILIQLMLHGKVFHCWR